MSKTMKEKAKMYWMQKALYYIEKGGYKNINRGLRYLKWSAILAEPEEKKYLSEGLYNLTRKTDDYMNRFES